jgi:hypothetical protein
MHDPHAWLHALRASLPASRARLHPGTTRAGMLHNAAAVLGFAQWGRLISLCQSSWQRLQSQLRKTPPQRCAVCPWTWLEGLF